VKKGGGIFSFKRGMGTLAESLANSVRNSANIEIIPVTAYNLSLKEHGVEVTFTNQTRMIAGQLYSPLFKMQIMCYQLYLHMR
jgi:hypothetical protein